MSDEAEHPLTPRGVLKPGQEGKVLRLKKGLYGLKQAGRGWYLEMSRVFLKELGFTWSAIDHLVFYRQKGDKHTIVAVATDDMAPISKWRIDAKNFKLEIAKHWEITDHRPINWFLGFQIKRDWKANINKSASLYWEHGRKVQTHQSQAGICYDFILNTYNFIFTFTITSWTTCHEHMFIYFYFLPCITRMSFILLLYQTHVEHALTMRYMHVLSYIYFSQLPCNFS